MAGYTVRYLCPRISDTYEAFTSYVRSHLLFFYYRFIPVRVRIIPIKRSKNTPSNNWYRVQSTRTIVRIFTLSISVTRVVEFAVVSLFAAITLGLALIATIVAAIVITAITGAAILWFASAATVFAIAVVFGFVRFVSRLFLVFAFVRAHLFVLRPL